MPSSVGMLSASSDFIGLFEMLRLLLLPKSVGVLGRLPIPWVRDLCRISIQVKVETALSIAKCCLTINYKFDLHLTAGRWQSKLTPHHLNLNTHS